jgi:magnesium transporter
MIKNNYGSQLEAIIATLDQDKLASISLISSMHYADIADLIDNISNENRVKLVNFIIAHFPRLIPKILAELTPTIREDIIDSIEHIETLFSHSNANQISYIIQDINESKKQNILKLLSDDLRISILERLAYPENTAGRIMHRQFASVPLDWNIEQVLVFLRSNKSLGDFNEVFVVNEHAKPVGRISLSTIIKSQSHQIVSELMNKYVEFAYDYMKQEEVSYICRQYGLMYVAVVDSDERLVGVIESEDVVELLEEEATEDLMRIAGIIDISDMHAAFIDTIKNRFPWLFINLITAALTSLIIIMFEDTIKQIVAVAAIMPIVASLGGNAGTQTLTVIVRAIANRELTLANSSKVILKEVFTAVITGILLAISGGIILFMMYHDLHLSIVFASAVVINFALAGFLGSFIPITLSRIGIDPATASVVFLTALTDIIGFFAFLSLSRWFLI